LRINGVNKFIQFYNLQNFILSFIRVLSLLDFGDFLLKSWSKRIHNLNIFGDLILHKKEIWCNSICSFESTLGIEDFIGLFLSFLRIVTYEVRKIEGKILEIPGRLLEHWKYSFSLIWFLSQESLNQNVTLEHSLKDSFIIYFVK